MRVVPLLRLLSSTHEQLNFTNPKWPAYLDQIRTHIDDALCVGTDLSLTNPRFLLCASDADPNDHIQQYIDYLSFGQLLIKLPSVNNSGLEISYPAFNCTNMVTMVESEFSRAWRQLGFATLVVN